MHPGLHPLITILQPIHQIINLRNRIRRQATREQTEDPSRHVASHATLLPNPSPIYSSNSTSEKPSKKSHAVPIHAELHCISGPSRYARSVVLKGTAFSRAEDSRR